MVKNIRYVFVNGIQSNKLPVTRGEPQGSILDSLLFLICINDLNVVSKLFKFMFADDTNIFIRGGNIEKLT